MKKDMVACPACKGNQENYPTILFNGKTEAQTSCMICYGKGEVSKAEEMKYVQVFTDFVERLDVLAIEKLEAQKIPIGKPYNYREVIDKEQTKISFEVNIGRVSKKDNP